jgi:hypothetical protein
MREQLRNVGVLALALVWGFPCAVFGLGAVIYFDEGWPERFSDLEMVIGIALSFGLWLGVMLLVGEVLERREREDPGAVPGDLEAEARGLGSGAGA